MANRSRKFLAVTLVIALILSSLALISTSAATEGSFVYTTNNGEVTITGYTGNTSSVNIPATIKGLPVTAIGDNAFRDCTNLSTITIPDSVIKVGREAFWNTAFLNKKENWESDVLYLGKILLDVNYTKKGSLVVKEGTTVIADYAMYMSSSITNVTIPSSVKYIGDSAFALCRKLDTISVTAKNTSLSSVDGVLFNKDKTAIICYPNGKGNLEYDIPKTVKTINAGAFMYCDDLQNITIPDTVTSIGKEAFAYCEALTTATIPSKITSISDGAFDHCGALNEVNFHDNVTYIGENAFKWCSALKEIKLPSKLVEIAPTAFDQCRYLKTITIPNTLKVVGDGAFHDCGDLTTVNYEGTESQWNKISIQLNNNPLVSAKKNYNAVRLAAIGQSATNCVLITLYDSRLVSYSQTPVAGATYGLYTSNWTQQDGSLREQFLVATATTTSSGAAKFVDKSGNTYNFDSTATYYIQEITAPEGYVYDNKIITVKPEDQNKAIKVYNKSFGAVLTIKHEYDSENPDKLVVYQVKNKLTNEILYFNTLSEGFVWMADQAGYNRFTAYPNEEIILNGLTIGSYYLERVNSESGKAETAAEFNVSINNNEIDDITLTLGENSSSLVLGDVTGEGNVNVKDATAIQKYLVKIITLSDEMIKNGDFNKDGKTNISDATAIQKMIAGYPY